MFKSSITAFLLNNTKITGIHKTNPVAVFFTSLIWPENVIEAFLVLQDMMFKAIKDWMITNGIKKKPAGSGNEHTLSKFLQGLKSELSIYSQGQELFFWQDSQLHAI